MRVCRISKLPDSSWVWISLLRTRPRWKLPAVSLCLTRARRTPRKVVSQIKFVCVSRMHALLCFCTCMHERRRMRSNSSISEIRCAETDIYVTDMLRCMRDVNVDNNTVGWYQSTYMNSWLDADSPTVETQFQFQVCIWSCTWKFSGISRSDVLLNVCRRQCLSLSAWCTIPSAPPAAACILRHTGMHRTCRKPMTWRPSLVLLIDCTLLLIIEFFGGLGTGWQTNSWSSTASIAKTTCTVSQRLTWRWVQDQYV